MNHQEVREFCEARGIMALAQPTPVDAINVALVDGLFYSPFK